MSLDAIHGDSLKRGTEPVAEKFSHLPNDILELITSQRPHASAEFLVHTQFGLRRYVLHDLVPPFGLTDDGEFQFGGGVVYSLVPGQGSGRGSRRVVADSNSFVGVFGDRNTTYSQVHVTEHEPTGQFSLNELCASESYYLRGVGFMRILERDYFVGSLEDITNQEIARFQSALVRLGEHDGGEEVWKSLTGLSQVESIGPHFVVDSESQNVFMGLDAFVMSREFIEYLHLCIGEAGLTSTSSPVGDPEYSNASGAFEFGVFDLYRKDILTTIRLGVYFLPEEIISILSHGLVGKMVCSLLQQVLEWSHHDFTAHGSLMILVDDTSLSKLFSSETSERLLRDIMRSGDLRRGAGDPIAEFETWSLEFHLEFVTEFVKRHPAFFRFLSILSVRFERLVGGSGLNEEQQKVCMYCWYFSINRMIDTAELVTVLPQEQLASLRSRILLGLDGAAEVGFMDTLAGRSRSDLIVSWRPKSFTTSDAMLLYRNMAQNIQTLRTIHASFRGRSVPPAGLIGPLLDKVSDELLVNFIVYSFDKKHFDELEEERRQLLVDADYIRTLILSEPQFSVFMDAYIVARLGNTVTFKEFVASVF